MKYLILALVLIFGFMLGFLAILYVPFKYITFKARDGHEISYNFPENKNFHLIGFGFN